MKTRSATFAALFGFLIAASIGVPDRLNAQAPPGPLPPPPQSQIPRPPRPKPKAKPKPPEITPRTTLDGAWKLNRDESDDPKTKIQDSRGTHAGSGGGGPSGGNYPGGGYPGGGYPGGGYPYPGGYPGGGYPGGGGPYGGPDTSARDTETDERLEQIVRPPATLNFSVKNPEVDLTDDESRRTAIFTDGRKLQKSKDTSYQEIAAHWSGSQLVTEEKTQRGAKMSRTFELSPDGRQFFETVHVDRGKSKGLLTLRYVYDGATGTESQLTHETDPDEPVMKRRSDSGTTNPNSQNSPSGQPSDPDQPVMKRGSNDGGSAPSPQTAPDTQSNPQPDPDQPVMKRRSGGQ